MGVAEPGQRLRLAGAVGDHPQQPERLLVARGRLPVPAEPVVDEAEAVESQGLTVRVADLAVQLQRGRVGRAIVRIGSARRICLWSV